MISNALLFFTCSHSVLSDADCPKQFLPSPQMMRCLSSRLFSLPYMGLGARQIFSFNTLTNLYARLSLFFSVFLCNAISSLIIRPFLPHSFAAFS